LNLVDETNFQNCMSYLKISYELRWMNKSAQMFCIAYHKISCKRETCMNGVVTLLAWLASSFERTIVLTGQPHRLLHRASASNASPVATHIIIIGIAATSLDVVTVEKDNGSLCSGDPARGEQMICVAARFEADAGSTSSIQWRCTEALPQPRQG
jgi:hypothetical protein